VSGRSDEGSEGLPWASVFDPVANARALEQIQRRGLRAAGELVDRLVSVVDGDPGRARPADAGADGGNRDGAASGYTAADGSDPLGVWVDLVTQTLQAMARLSVPEPGPGAQPTGGPVWVDVLSGRGSGAFELMAGPTASATGELWLHNPSAHAVGPLRLHVGELRSPDGQSLPPGALRLDPESVGELPPRSSRGVSACFVAPDAADPPPSGRYRGLLQADGADAVAVPLELVIRGPG
jgi:hypothetical protein